MRDRIRPPRDLEKVLDALKDDGLFDTKQKAIMFAAALGFARDSAGNRGLDLETTGEGIRLEYFERQRDDRFIDLMAVAHAGDLRILDDARQPERVDIFERYAHVGLREIQRSCYEQARTPLDGLLRLFEELLAEAPPLVLPGLESDLKRLEGLL